MHQRLLRPSVPVFVFNVFLGYPIANKSTKRIKYRNFVKCRFRLNVSKVIKVMRIRYNRVWGFILVFCVKIIIYQLFIYETLGVSTIIHG